MSQNEIDASLDMTGIPIKERLWILWHYRWLIATLTLIATVVVGILTFFQKDRFTSQAILQIDVRPLRLSRYDNAMGDVGSDQVMRYIDTQAKLLKSYNVLQKAYENLNSISSGVLDPKKGVRVPISKHPLFLDKDENDTIAILSKNLVVRYSNNNHLIFISYESVDPDLSYAIVSQVIKAFHETRIDAELKKLGSYSTNVDRQLEEHKHRLDKARAALTKFFESSSISPGSTLINPLERDKENLRNQKRALESDSRKLLDIIERIRRLRQEAKQPATLAVTLKRMAPVDLELHDAIAQRDILIQSKARAQAAFKRLGANESYHTIPKTITPLATLWRMIGAPYFQHKISRLTKTVNRLAVRDYLCANLDNLPCIVGDTSVNTYDRELAEYRQKRAFLLQTLEPNHWQIQEIDRAVAQTNSEKFKRIYSVLVSRELDYERIMRAMDDLTQKQTELQAKYAELQKELTDLEVRRYNFKQAKELYEDMWNAKNAATYGGEAMYDDISIRQDAIRPEKPSGPNRKRIIILSFILFLFLSGGLAFLLEFMDETIRSQSDVERFIQAPLVGVLPHISIAGHDRKQRDLICHVAPTSLGAEAFRTLRTTINLSLEPKSSGAKILLLTSASQAEGKTTLNINLSIIFSQSNNRVLLIDADMRRPAAHLSLGQKQSPGLSDILSGNCSIEETILTDFGPNSPAFHLLPSGPVPANPAELLETAKMKELIAWTRERYDVVIIDTPPVLAVTDSRILAPLADCMLLTALSGRTRKNAARRAWELLLESHANLIGVVLNDTKSDILGYGYRYGYGYGYGYGAGADSERRREYSTNRNTRSSE